MAGIAVIMYLLAMTAHADIMVNSQTAVCGIREYGAHIENF